MFCGAPIHWSKYTTIIDIKTYKVLSCAHGMANKESVFMLSLFQDIINDCCKVLCPTLVPAVVPKIWTFAASFQSGVVSGVSVPSGIQHPNIIACNH